MASKGYTSVGALLAILGLALVTGCERAAPAAPAPPGELAVDCLPQADGAEGVSRVELEVRGVGGEVSIRRRVVLDTSSSRDARLSLPPGVYALQLRSATWQADGATLAETRLALPPPQIVLVSATNTTRARVALATPAPAPATLAMLSQTF